MVGQLGNMHGKYPMSGITRESLIAITTNIESREYRRRMFASENRPPEHPRSATTDDVECFFQLCEISLGKTSV